MMNRETITISYVGKFGPSVNGEWYNVDQKSGIKPTQFEKGKTYDVLINVAKSGKKYITQIVGEGGQPNYIKDGEALTATTNTPSNIPVKAGDDKVIAPRKDKKETDWDGIARGKVACAMFQAALQSPGLAMYVTSKEEYLKLVNEVAKAGIDFTWKHQKGE